MLWMSVLVFLLVLPSSAWAEMLTVKGSDVNFRSGPSTEDEVVYIASRYFPVQVLKRQKRWVYTVDFEGERAWVASWLLDHTPSVIVKVGRGNVRAKPTTSSTIEHRIERGSVYRILERQGEWMRIQDEQTTLGWVHRSIVWGHLG